MGDEFSHPLPLRLSWDGWSDSGRAIEGAIGERRMFCLVPPICSIAFHVGMVALIAGLLHLAPLPPSPAASPVIRVIFLPPSPEPTPSSAASLPVGSAAEAPPKITPELSPGSPFTAKPLPPTPSVAETPPPEPFPPAPRTELKPKKPIIRPSPKPAVRRPRPWARPHPIPAQAPVAPRVLAPLAATPVSPEQTAGAVSPRPIPAPPIISAVYRSALVGWLNNHKHYPNSARERGEEGRAIVHFRVDRSGRVLSYAVVARTGYADLDAEIDEMLRGAMMPPFPADMIAPQIDVTVTISFGLTR
jgi:periplasmic protein TonB